MWDSWVIDRSIFSCLSTHLTDFDSSCTNLHSHQQNSFTLQKQLLSHLLERFIDLSFSIHYINSHQ